jgi:hypothetical protein
MLSGNIHADLEESRTRAMVAINDKSEFSRLLSIIAAEHNFYGAEVEIKVWENLFQCLCFGFLSEAFDSVGQINDAKFFIEHGFVSRNSKLLQNFSMEDTTA